MKRFPDIDELQNFNKWQIFGRSSFSIDIIFKEIVIKVIHDVTWDLV